MKNRKRLSYITGLLILLILTVLLSGCQLAVETGAIAARGDRLCGVLVTFHKIYEGSSENTDLSNASIEGEIDYDTWTLIGTDKSEGNLSEDGYSINFDGVKGFYLGFVNYFDDNLKTGVHDIGFYDTKNATIETNEGITQTCEATLYVSMDFQDVVTANPVYARPNGSYYVVRGGMSSVLPASLEDAPTSINQEASYTTTVDGVTSTVKDSFKVNIVPTRQTKELFIKEMNKADELIKTTEYFVDSPAVFTVDKDTEYVIVEELMESNLHIDRIIYSFGVEVNESNPLTHRSNFSDKTGVIGLTIIEFKKND